MDGQLLLTWLAIALAGVYVLLRVGLAWRGLRGGASCGGGCGCPKKSADAVEQPALIKSEQLKMRQR
jgi:hypothetical protein